MKPPLILFIVAIMVQQFAMYFFMRIVQWRLFESGAMAVLIALAVYFILYFIWKHFASHRSK
jgi:fatty acid desaturase